jgi:hypothetical protein
MSAKKIYVATITYEFDMYVVADNRGEAEEVAKDNCEEELRYNFWDTPLITLREGSPRFDGKEDSIPWGDNEDEKTVAEFIAEQVEREREAEEKRRIEANQLKLPLATKEGA